MPAPQRAGVTSWRSASTRPSWTAPQASVRAGYRPPPGLHRALRVLMNSATRSRASIIGLRERDGDVAVVIRDTRRGDGPGREISEAQAEVSGLEGKTLILDALLPRPSPQ
jgi:hypothetical protein